MTHCDQPTTIAYWMWLTLTALAVRLVVAFGLFGGIPQSSDPLAYVEQAQQMATGEAGSKTYYWPPGRSFCLVPFVLVFGASDAVARANSVFFDVACVLVVAALAHQVLRRRTAARMAGWIAALYPPAVMLSGWAYSMNVVMFFMVSSASFALAAMSAYRKNRLLSLGAWFASGGLLGCAILTRPSSVSVLLLSMVGWIGFLAVRSVKPAWVGTAASTPLKAVLAAGAAFVIGVLCCTAPIAKRHADLGAGWVVSTNNEATFFYGNNRYTPHYKSWEHDMKAFSPEYKQYIASFKDEPNPRNAMVLDALRYIEQRPDIFVLRTANRVRSFWGFDYLASGNVRAAWPHFAAKGGLACLAVEAGGYCAVMVLVICGLFLIPGRMDAKLALFLIAPVAAYQLPYAIVYACGSYRFPVMGFLFPFAGLALDELRRNKGAFWHTIRGKKWLWIAMAIFAAVQIEYAYHLLTFRAL